jgi:hypothetical protein
MRTGMIGWMVLAAGAWLAGCWDEPEHELDTDVSSGETDSDTSSAGDADADVDSDTGTDPSVGGPQGDLPAGWEGFGTACVDDADCNGYPGSTDLPKCCLTDVLGIIGAPNGFCTACCNAAAIDGCAENVDCVGVDNTYLICLAHCDQLSDCRVSEGWECRPIWYMSQEEFPGTYCLPDGQHVIPDTDIPLDDPHCPWPWL